MGLRKQLRLKREKDFQRTLKGKVRETRNLRIFSVDNSLEHPRFGIIVSKKVAKKAVKRNRIKRIIREAIRLNMQVFPKKDFVIIVKRDISELKRQDMERELCSRRL